MASVPFEYGLLLAGVLFSLGLVGVIVRRNLLFILLCVEIMLNAAGLAFVVAGARWGQPDGQVMFIFLLAMAAAEVAVGLALLLLHFGRRKTLDADAMKWGMRRIWKCLSWIWCIPALPFAGFLVLAVFGGRLSRGPDRGRSAPGPWVSRSRPLPRPARCSSRSPPAGGSFTLVLWQWISVGRVLPEHLLHPGRPLRGHDPRGDGRGLPHPSLLHPLHGRTRKATAGSSPT